MVAREGVAMGGSEAARAERLAAALRENLKRRKQQAKGRSAAGPPREAEPADTAAPAAAPEPPRTPE